jgi:3-O-methylgallate 3,4-dioxygenase
MAELILAAGTSHSPALNSPADDYPRHAERDKANPNLLDKEGRPCSYDELLSSADPAVAAHIAPDAVAERIAACDNGIERLARAFSAAAPDSVIIVGDDQQEQYFDDNMPAVLVYWGERILNTVSPLPEDAPAYWKRARAQYHEESGPREYPVDSALGRHLIETLIGREFDVSHATELRHDRGEGHAFGFVHRRVLRDRIVPVVPVVLNTYFPPNQPSPRRCYELGRAIAAAVEQWPRPDRVAIIASGGLSHFTVDEELDRRVLDACRAKDAQALTSLSVAKLNSGNSEIRNWITVAGAAEALDTEWQEYVPCYRTPAGTGCGMAFAVWS